MTDNVGNKHEVYTLLPEFAGAILLDNPASDPAKCEGPFTGSALGFQPVEPMLDGCFILISLPWSLPVLINPSDAEIQDVKP